MDEVRLDALTAAQLVRALQAAGDAPVIATTEHGSYRFRISQVSIADGVATLRMKEIVWQGDE